MAGKRGTFRRLVVRLLLAPVMIVLAYAVAALIGGAIPANNGWRMADQGVRIYVEDNGVHTGIVVPVFAEGVDWRDKVRPEHIADPAYAAHPYLAFGWGDRDFYLNTPSWSDIDAKTLLRALIGSGETVLHVEHVAEPRPDRSTRAVVLRPEEYRLLAAQIRATFADGPPRSQHGYGGWDAFYAAQGRYNAFNTCNAWTGRVLRTAGIRMGAWTPLSWTVMHWLPVSKENGS